MDKRTHLIERAAARLQPFGAATVGLAASAGASSAAVRSFAPGFGPAEQRLPPKASVNKAVPDARIGTEMLVQAGLIASGALYNRVAEEFRIIQSKVLRRAFTANTAAEGTPTNLVLITSSVKHEGKTFCSLNLAAEVARQGDRKVLLIDTDPKPDALSRRLGNQGEGLLDLARGTHRNADTLTVPSDVEGLDFLPFGTNGQGSAELFASRRMAETIADIGRRDPQRLVMLDAPPALASSTPHTLAANMGQVILVVAAGRTQDTDIEAALDLLQACEHVSLLLNKVPTWLAHSFGSYAYPTLKT